MICKPMPTIYWITRLVFVLESVATPSTRRSLMHNSRVKLATRNESSMPTKNRIQATCHSKLPRLGLPARLSSIRLRRTSWRVTVSFLNLSPNHTSINRGTKKNKYNYLGCSPTIPKDVKKYTSKRSHSNQTARSIIDSIRSILPRNIMWGWVISPTPSRIRRSRMSSKPSRSSENVK